MCIKNKWKNSTVPLVTGALKHSIPELYPETSAAVKLKAVSTTIIGCVIHLNVNGTTGSLNPRE